MVLFFAQTFHMDVEEKRKEKRCSRTQNTLIAETSFFDQVQVGDALRNPLTVFLNRE